MVLTIVRYIFFGIAAIPFVYYLIVLYSSWQFFRDSKEPKSSAGGFAPAVSILKPIRGLDPGAYENFASFCRQDYPEYEILFCVGDRSDPALPVIEKLIADFPERAIRVLYGSGRDAANDKVAKLVRLVNEARNEVLVINDSDVRARPDYLRTMVAPLADPKVGAVTCFYAPVRDTTFAEHLQMIGMISDFYAGILVARQLDGVKFALGPTISTTKTRLAGFGGYEAIENRPADDLLVGRLIAEQGFEVVLLNYVVPTVADYESMGELLHKRMRWMVVMRLMRPWGHLGLLLTQGLPWCAAAVAIQPSAAVAAAYFGIYGVLRAGICWMIGIRGLKQRGLWWRLPLIPVWDALAFLIWLGSFLRSSIRWRGVKYYIREGMLIPANPGAAEPRK